MRSLCFLGGGILLGIAGTHIEATRKANAAAGEELINQVNAHKRALEIASERFLAEHLVEAPVTTEDELEETVEEAVQDEEITAETKATSISDVTPSADYLKTAIDYHGGNNLSVVLPVEYIDEDEFQEEDGRAKEQILIHAGAGGEDLFISDGVLIVDWQEILPPNLVVDMFQMAGPGQKQVVYVRNHRNDTDYEVIREVP